MTTTPDSRPGNPPIYDELIEQHGDVLAESRKAAQNTEAEAATALDWSGLRPAAAADD